MGKNQIQIECQICKRGQGAHRLFTVTGLIFLLMMGVCVLSEAATLSERLISTSGHTRYLALKELSKLGPETKKGLVPPLIEALKDENKYVRRGAAEALRKIGPEAKEAIPLLIESLKDSDSSVRIAVAEALGRIGSEAILSLIEALKDEDKDVRWHVARALRKIGPEAEEAVPALIEALNDKDKSVRYSAITALGEIGPAAGEAIPALIIARSTEGMAGIAIDALRKIGPATKEAIPGLIVALKDKDRWVRQSTIGALEEIGPAAGEAVPALIEALKDKDSTIPPMAARALGKIGPTEQTIPINEKLGDIFYKSQNWDDALKFYAEAMRLDPQNPSLKEKLNRCRQIAKLEKERFAKGLVVYKDKSSETIKVRYGTPRFSLLSRLSKGKLIERARNAMVTILAGDRQGSGFLISDDGYLLTNEHVVGGARFVKAKFLTGRQVSGEVIRVNKFKDVALVKLERDIYPYLLIGDSSKVNVGKDVYAIGTPLSEKLSHTVTKGIVSSFRTIDDNRYIQSDVSVHPGNSGGPLISIGNGVVGICVSGIGFGPITLDLNLFIPIEDAIDSLQIVKP